MTFILFEQDNKNREQESDSLLTESQKKRHQKDVIVSLDLYVQRARGMQWQCVTFTT